jgi:hypothetical protein
MTKRRNEKGQPLCQWGERSEHPCPNVALWDVIVDGDSVGLTCEECAQHAFNFNVRKNRVRLKSLATGKSTTLGALLKVA